MRRRRAVVGPVALAVAMGLAGCGISTSGGPKAISKNQVPNVPAGVTTTTGVPDDVGVTIVLLDLADNNAPVAVLRAVPPQSDQLSTVLSLLLQGPQAREPRRGLFTAIPKTTRLISVVPKTAAPAGPAPSGGVIVNLSNDFIEGNGLSQEQEVQQIVSTVACFFSPLPAAKVSFEVEGLPQEVPISNGTSVQRPVTVADYGPVNCTPSSG